MSYTIKEVSKLTNIPTTTLRYYDKEGLLPFLERRSSGYRAFSDIDISMKDEKTCLKRKIPVGLIYTMNCPENLAKQIGYDMTLGSDENACKRVFGHCEVLNSYDTYQFNDYSKY